MDFREFGDCVLIGWPQLLTALDEQGLADSLGLAFGPTFGPSVGLSLGHALSENALVNRRLFDPTNPVQHGGYPLMSVRMPLTVGLLALGGSHFLNHGLKTLMTG